MKRLNLRLCTGNPPGIREPLDLRAYWNNYIGFAFVIGGWGLRVSWRLRNALRDFGAGA